MLVRTIAVTLACIILFFANEVRAAEPKIKIGVITSLTLDAAAYGTDTKNAVTLANELLAQNAYELIVEDEQSSTQGALRGYQKLVNYDGVKYIIGFSLNSSLIALSPIAMKSGVGRPDFSDQRNGKL